MFARSRVEILPQSPLRHWRKRFRMTSKQNQMLKHPCGLEARKIKMKTGFGNGQTAVPGTLKLRQSPWKKRPQGTVSNSSEMELTIGELMIALKRTISCAAKSTVLVLILVSIRSLMLWMNLFALYALCQKCFQQRLWNVFFGSRDAKGGEHHMHSASLFAFCLFGSSHFLLHLILFLLLFTLCMIQMEIRPRQLVSPPSQSLFLCSSFLPRWRSLFTRENRVRLHNCKNTFPYKDCIL